MAVNNCIQECPKYFDLGCVPHCDILCTSVIADSDDTYMILYKSPIGKERYEIEVLEGDEIKLDIKHLNENMESVIQIYDSTGALIKFEEGDCTYEGLKIQVEIVKSNC